MNRDLTHDEIEQLLGAYALDAVESEERAAVEEHLARCARCRAEVDRHLETAALLGQAASQPPDELWTRISDRLEGPRRGRSDAVPELRTVRPRRRLALRVGAGLAAAGAAAAIAFLVVKIDHQASRIDELTASPQASLAQAAAAALESRGAERVVLSSEDGTTAVDAVVLSDGTGYLLGDGLAPLPAGRTYQLWAVVDDRVISAGVLGADPSVVAFHVDGDLDGLVITEERAGGVVSSESPALVAWLSTV